MEKTDNMTTYEILENAKAAKKDLAAITTTQKNTALKVMAEKLIENTEVILSANAVDMENAKGKLANSMLDRLLLTADRVKAMASSLVALTSLPDPCGNIIDEIIRPNGIKISKVSVPMGVIGIIYESRPNVTSDAAALCFKGSNVAVLRSGKDAINSARAIVKAMREGLQELNISPDCINLLEDTSRDSANALMTATGYVDLLIPRGGKGLISACVQNATVPCIETGTGICHIYVEKTADFQMALNIIENAKTSRPSVCNACEVCLVDSEIAAEFLPLLKERLKNVELRLCPVSAKIINGKAANENDFDTEFLDYILAVKVVDNYSEAINHISAHSTHHSEAIVTKDNNAITAFTSLIDSAAVYVNASTRITDGGEFGLGCEMGMSTQKLHARGPMGLSELTTYKYIINGEGQIR